VEKLHLFLYLLWVAARCRLSGRSLADLEAAERKAFAQFPPVSFLSLVLVMGHVGFSKNFIPDPFQVVLSSRRIR